MDTKEKKTTSGKPRAATGKAPKAADTVRRRTKSPATPEEPKRRVKNPVVPEEPKRRVRTRKTEESVAKTKTAVPAPDVVYTPAKPFSRERFLLRLATVVAVVIAMMFGISIFVRVEHGMVAGAEKYTP